MSAHGTHTNGFADAAAARPHPVDGEVRLLPWTTADGRPTFLVGDDPSSLLSRQADECESTQLDVSLLIVERARSILGDPDAAQDDLRHAGIRLAETLDVVLRVATSRGERLGNTTP